MRPEELFATHSDVTDRRPNTGGWVAAICRGSEGVVVCSIFTSHHQKAVKVQ
jgi:hypothetical protein